MSTGSHSRPGADAGDPAAPAGWYPVDGGTQRYWDGQVWTEHVAPGPGPTPWHPQSEDHAGFGQLSGTGAPFGQPSGSGASSRDPVGGVPLAVQPPWATHIPTSEDRSMAVLVHVLALLTGFLGPLVLWLVKRDQSEFVDYHGKEAVNFQLSLMLYWVCTVIAIFFLIGLLFFPVLFVLQILFPILAAVAANRGDRYRYPLSIRFIS